MKGIAQNDVLKKNNLALEEDFQLQKLWMPKDSFWIQFLNSWKILVTTFSAFGMASIIFIIVLKKGYLTVQSEDVQNGNIFIYQLMNFSEDSGSFSLYSEDDAYYGSNESN